MAWPKGDEVLSKLRALGARVGQRVDHPLGDPRELRRMIDEIPGNNALRALDEVLGWLESLQGADDFPVDRLYEAVSSLDDVAQRHLRRLTRDYFFTLRMSGAEEQRLWEASHGFWTVLAASYERCLPSAGSQAKVADRKLPELTARLIVALGGILKWQQFRYRAAPGELWQRLGAALLIAESAGVATRTVSLNASLPGVSSPQLEFVKVVAFHASSMDSLLPLEIELAERLIAHFAAGLVFSEKATSDSVYWVDLVLAQPPRRLTRMPVRATPTQRFFKPGKAHAGIAALLIDLERGGDDVSRDINLGGQQDSRVLLPLLRHLASHLAPIPPQRRHGRHRIKQRVIVLPGLNNALGAFSGQPPGHAAGVAMESWVVEDVSHGGFGALLNAMPGEWLKIGALIVVQPAGGTWRLGIVRRVQRLDESAAHVGVETLAQMVQPADLIRRTASSYVAIAGIPALLIREDNEPGVIRAVMPSGSFDPRQVLDWSDDGQRVGLKPVELVEHGDDYDVARYRLGTTG